MIMIIYKNLKNSKKILIRFYLLLKKKINSQGQQDTEVQLTKSKMEEKS